MKTAAHRSPDSLLGSEIPLAPDRPGESALVKDLRLRARDRFADRGFEVRGREEWKYSDLKPVIEGGYLPYRESGEATPETTAWTTEAGAWRLVFVNGIYRGDLSRVADLPAGVTLLPLARAPEASGLGELADPDRFPGAPFPALNAAAWQDGRNVKVSIAKPREERPPRRGLGELADLERFPGAPFTALNTAAWQDGLLLELPEGLILAHPVELNFLTDERAAGRLVAPRNLIRIGRGARATVIELYRGAPGSAVLNAPVTEIFCGEDSVVGHWKVVREDDRGLHYGSTHVRQSTGSRYSSAEFSFGGAGVRRELHLDLAGTAAECDLTSLAMAGSRQRMDMRTRVNHLVPGCTTSELYKGIYDDRSGGVFDGLIRVQRDAQQTVAHQTNRNLLLSDDSAVSSIPRLEIYADDVKCSHGSTTGQLDQEQVFFLRARGFDESSARTMLAQAFAREIVEGVGSPDLRQVLNREIARRLAVVEHVEETR